ncbi:hypothetical protein KP05_17100 [Cobetia amphilecti]|uniref:ankyrin repeat domain-containing protein n=1 Tax=Cobetia amphilecti TaxID=1055104 RepID=UPI0005052D09|nr:ankyrin repeat domain-containing protein [Cobetia amphilecti]KGA00790.1 hypothetical protein KP05_17100 [Cobetia amphilecti]
MTGWWLGLLASLLLCVMAGPALAASDIDIFDAARDGDNAAIREYVQQGGDLSVTNSRSYTPFILAAYYGHTDSLVLMKSAGADACALDEKGSNAFMGVAFRGFDETAKWLLANTDCDVDHRNYSGQTALMMASLFGNEDIIKLLLQAGADPSIQDARGNTAQSLAAAQGLSRIVTLVKFNM